MMTDIVGIAYCSKPMSFSFEKVDAILAVSRVKNAEHGITGALIYDNRTFLQWLEGTSSDVRATWERISKDDRHTEIKLLSVRKLEGRLFPDWSMTAAVTEDQSLRSLKLVPHLSLTRFDPFNWSEADVSLFMESLSDYLTHRPAPKSEPVAKIVPRRGPDRTLVSDLDQLLNRMT
jgi:hypothetical protein